VRKPARLTGSVNLFETGNSHAATMRSRHQFTPPPPVKEQRSWGLTVIVELAKFAIMMGVFFLIAQALAPWL
jgi:hypothetical protein